MEAPHDMLLGLKERLPAITSTLNSFADKYGIFMHLITSGKHIEEAFDAVGQHVFVLSIYFWDTVQFFLDGATKFLKETQLKLHDYEEITTLPVLLKQLTSAIASILEQAIQMIIGNLESWR